MNKEENSKILYKITAYDSDFIKEIPDKVRTIGGTINYYYYDCKKHRYLSQFVSDDFDIYDEFKRLIEENTHLQQENQQLKEKIILLKASESMLELTKYINEKDLYKERINKAIEYISECCLYDEECKNFNDDLDYYEIPKLMKILKGDTND